MTVMISQSLVGVQCDDVTVVISPSQCGDMIAVISLSLSCRSAVWRRQTGKGKQGVRPDR